MADDVCLADAVRELLEAAKETTGATNCSWLPDERIRFRVCSCGCGRLVCYYVGEGE